MHKSAYKIMQRLVNAHALPRFDAAAEEARGIWVTMLDVGSRRIDLDDSRNCDLFPYQWSCIGLDQRDGDNVTFVVDILDFRWETPKFWVITCGQMLEHCRAPWRAVENMAYCLRPGGVLLLTAPFMWHLHDHPGDFFRFSGEGLAELCRQAGLHVLECGQVSVKRCRADAWCAAEKVAT